MSRGVRGEFFSEESGAKIDTHDGHPAEHGDGGEVAEVSDDLAEKFVKISVKNSDEESSEECYADDIAQYNSSMETVEFRDKPIDDEDDKQGEKTDNSCSCEDCCYITMCQPARIGRAPNYHHPCVLGGTGDRGDVLHTEVRGVQVPGAGVPAVHNLHHLQVLTTVLQARMMLNDLLEKVTSRLVSVFCSFLFCPRIFRQHAVHARVEHVGGGTALGVRGGRSRWRGDWVWRVGMRCGAE